MFSGKLLSSALLCLALTREALSSTCKCTFGDTCWPSQSDFDSLQRQISQPLIHPAPPAQPCYTDVNSSECAAVVEGWTDGNWRADQAGAMQSPNFETYRFPNGTIDACYFNTSLGVSCQQGSVSVLGVDARTVSDVQAAVKFAVKHNLRLVVKNTGHDYLGRSNARGSFVVWTHHLKNITVVPSFRPTAAPKGETYEHAITIGAGVQWHEAYAAANASGRALVGGVSEGGSVGAAGGWLLGGGHSALAPAYGLGVDNVLEISLVTSTGNHITANAHRHSDIFWALRGGGGGTYGVVTSVTYRTHPAVPVIAAFFVAAANTTRPNAPLRQALGELVRITPNLTDAGWGGYTSLTPVNGTLSYTFFYVIPNVTWEQANATIVPYFDYVQRIAANSSVEDGGLTITAALTVPFPSFYDWFSAVIPTTGQVGGNTALGSWLLPRDLLENEHENVADTLTSLSNMNYYLVAGGAVSHVDPSSTGLNPAWRKANAHVVLGASWAEGANASTIDAQLRRVQADTAKLRALAPQSGAYFNEASSQEPNPKHTFFGSHYAALRAIKRVYDPSDLFIVKDGVGSDEWDEDLTCRI